MAVKRRESFAKGPLGPGQVKEIVHRSRDEWVRKAITKNSAYFYANRSRWLSFSPKSFPKSPSCKGYRSRSSQNDILSEMGFRSQERSALYPVVGFGLCYYRFATRAPVHARACLPRMRFGHTRAFHACTRPQKQTCLKST